MLDGKRRPALSSFGSTPEQKGHDAAGMMRWLLTYADLITLLLAFFVVMYGSSRVDVQRWQQVSQSLRAAFGIQAGGANIIGDAPGRSVIPLSAQDEAQFAAIVEQIRAYVAQAGLEGKITTSITPRGLVINLSDNILFDTGQADLKPDARAILDKLAGILLKIPNPVRVEGHTDNVPIHNDRYPSNWQLSTDRATNVVIYWIDKYHFPPARLSAAGYGEYRPLVPNDSDAHRARNRRVDIVVLKEALAQLEPGSTEEAPAAQAPSGF